MQSFLEQIARKLYDRYGDDISSLNIMFPNRRSRLFFNDALLRIAEKPIWQPEYLTIDDIAAGISSLKPADDVKLLAELFRQYSRFHDETFDSFYFWGEVLLSDFDMVDKYKIDARMLLSNVKDLRTIDGQLSYLTDEQRAVVEKFWKNVNSGTASEEKEKFLTVWDSLFDIYTGLRESLTVQGLGYTGMIHRNAVEKIESGTFAPAERETYVIAGFNALSECEKKLFDFLSKNHTVHFAWDYDHYFVEGNVQEAGMFIRDNIRRFPGEAWLETTHTGFYQPKNITVVSAPSDSMQCKYAGEILSELAGGGALPDKETGIILTDENLLVPMLDSVPELVQDINVTMGYPIKLTPAYSLVDRIVGLYQRSRRSGGKVLFYHADVSGLLTHPYIHQVYRSSSDMADAVRKKGRAYIDAGMIFARPSKKDQSVDVVVQEGPTVTSALSEGIQTDPQRYANNKQSDSGEQSPPLPEPENSVNESLKPDFWDGDFRLERVFDADPGHWKSLAELIISLTDSLCSVFAARQIHDESEVYSRDISFLRLVSENITTLVNNIETAAIEVSSGVFSSLIRRRLQSVNVPFEGEPLKGIQIMGILETRNLDFKNVIMLSVTDDNFPGNLFGNVSFIPQNLKYAYGLPTPSHHEGVYGYYFYRLLQRAENITLIYSNRSDERSSGERSRYIYQLDYESPHKVEYLEVGVNPVLNERRVKKKVKDDKVMALLSEFTRPDGRKLSPTAFFNYLQCPLKFYYYSVAGIRPEDAIAEDVDDPLFGTILHRALEILYKPLVDRGDVSRELASLGTEDILRCVDSAVKEEFRDIEDVEADGKLLLIRNIVASYVNKCVMPYDKSRAPFTIESLERRLSGRVEIDADGGITEVYMTGLADRVDIDRDGFYRIVDYKSGAERLKFNGVEALFSNETKDLNSAVLQVLIYSMMLSRMTGGNVRPQLYFVRKMSDPQYCPLPFDKEKGDFVSDYYSVKGRFEILLKEKLEELFNRDIDFAQCIDIKPCMYCDFKVLCRK